MQNNNKKNLAAHSLFSAVDEKIVSATGKTTITYKKETVTQMVFDNLKEAGYLKNDVAVMVNNFVDHMKKTLLDGNAIVIKDHGRLVPRLKAGGRPVRDLSRNKVIEMKETATVTFSKNKKIDGEKITSREMTRQFIENNAESDNSRILAIMVAMVFMACIVRTKSENHRMEVRGLGVFRSKTIKERVGRNPKTGEQTVIEEATYPRFRVSKPFRDELTEKLTTA